MTVTHHELVTMASIADTHARISRALLDGLEAGMTPVAALDAVFGVGAGDRIIGGLYDALRARTNNAQ